MIWGLVIEPFRGHVEKFIGVRSGSMGGPFWLICVPIYDMMNY